MGDYTAPPKIAVKLNNRQILICRVGWVIVPLHLKFAVKLDLQSKIGDYTAPSWIAVRISLQFKMGDCTAPSWIVVKLT